MTLTRQNRFSTGTRDGIVRDRTLTCPTTGDQP